MPSVPKKKRVRDRATVRDCRKSRCEVCGEKVYGGCHHVIGKAAGGGDLVENLISLCQTCHIFEAHGGHYSKDFLFGIIAEREGKTLEEIKDIAWGAKV